MLGVALKCAPSATLLVPCVPEAGLTGRLPVVPCCIQHPVPGQQRLHRETGVAVLSIGGLCPAAELSTRSCTLYTTHCISVAPYLLREPDDAVAGCTPALDQSTCTLLNACGCQHLFVSADKLSTASSTCIRRLIYHSPVPSPPVLTDKDSHAGLLRVCE